MTIRYAFIALLAVVLFGTQPAVARKMDNRGQQGHHQTMDWKKQLDLSDEQVQKIDKIKESAHNDMRSLRAEKWQLYKSMLVMSHEKTINQQKLDKLISNMNTVSEKMMRHEIKVKHDIYNVLTPKQQAKMNDMMQKKLKRMEKIYGN